MKRQLWITVWMLVALPLASLVSVPVSAAELPSIEVGLPQNGLFGLGGQYIIDKKLDRKNGFIMKPRWAGVSEIQRLLGIKAVSVGLMTPEAALRAKRAGFDIVYCYSAHEMTAANQFISRRYNNRTDEYGGSLENRVRFLRELIEDTKDAVGDTCAIAVRFVVDELIGEEGITHQDEGYNVIAMLAEFPMGKAGGR